MHMFGGILLLLQHFSALISITLPRPTLGVQLKVTHSAPITDAIDRKNLRVLYRFHGPSSREFVFVADTNHIYHFDSNTLHIEAVETVGPRNFSIFCFKDGNNCMCADLGPSVPPTGHGTDSCVPGLTDNFVKAWATSTVPEEEVQRVSNPHAPRHFSPVTIVNDDRIACEDALYLCYSLFNGFCERRRLTDLREPAPWMFKSPLYKQEHIDPEDIPVTGNDPSTFTVLVVGSKYVYVGTESSELQEYTLIKPHPLSARFRNFQYAKSHQEPNSYLRLTVPQTFRIQYQLAFRYRTHDLDSEIPLPKPAHVYFVLQQPATPQFYRWQPRIARVCDDDSQFDSYVELTLSCQECTFPNNEAVTFTSLRKAARGSVGWLLQMKLKEKSAKEHHKVVSKDPGDFSEVLVVAFGAQHADPIWYHASVAESEGSPRNPYLGYERDDDEFRGSLVVLFNGSALSLFSMGQIDFHFHRVITNCRNGQGVTGPAHFLTSRERKNNHCIPDHSSTDGHFYCPLRRTTNRLITGHTYEDAVESPAFLHLPYNITGLAVTSVSDLFTVVIMTTDDGRLLKHEIIELNETRQLDELQLTSTNQPLTDLALDLTGTVAFVTTPGQLIRIELFNCASHSTCASCITARDPYCGWCVIEGRCSLKQECQSAGFLRADKPSRSSHYEYCVPDAEPEPFEDAPFTWLSYTRTVDECPLLENINPTGVQELTASISDYMKYADHTSIVLNAEGLLTKELHLIMKLSTSHKGDRWIESSAVKRGQLRCAFRQLPNATVYSEDVLRGAANGATLTKLLKNLHPGPLLASSPAQVDARMDAIRIHCDVPPHSEMPLIPPTQVSLPIILWLEWSPPPGKLGTGVSALAPALFSVYDCGRLTDCRSCTLSRFNCTWCLMDDRCVPAHFASTPSGCPKVKFVPPNIMQQRSKINAVFSGQSEHCPSFQVDGEPTTLMSGSTLVVRLTVFNVPQPLRHFSCLEGCTNQRAIAAYSPSDSTVLCRIDKIDLGSNLHSLQSNKEMLIVSETSAAVNCSLDLYWHDDGVHSEDGHRLVNINNFQVEVYDCGWLVEYCDVCLRLPARFGCGWCILSETPDVSQPNTGMCTTRSQCAARSHGEEAVEVNSRTWLLSHAICPDPQILSLTPLNGTLTGQTVLTVSGRNLGRNVTDLVGRVYLESVHLIPCIVLTETYQSSRSFRCRLSPAKYLSLPASGRLKVAIGERAYQAFSPIFQFLNPYLMKIAPERGPMAGGTILRLSGSNLNIGSQRSVLLLSTSTLVTNFSIPCDIQSELQHMITCRTRAFSPDIFHSMTSQQHPTRRKRSPAADDTEPASYPSSSSQSSRMTMTVVLMNDLTATKPALPFTFFYSANPRITAVKRRNVLASGGTLIRVSGEHLYATESPRVVIYFNSSVFSAPCSYHTGELECLSPAMIDNFSEQVQTFQSVPLLATSTTLNPSSGHFEVIELDTLTYFLEHVDLKLRELVRSSLLKHIPVWPMDLAFGFIMDGVTTTRAQGTLMVHSDPTVDHFVGGLREEELDSFTPGVQNRSPEPVVEIFTDSYTVTTAHNKNMSLDDNEPFMPPSVRARQLLRLFGQFDSLVAAPELAAPDELSIRLGDSLACEISSVITTEIRCDLDLASLKPGLNYPVIVQFGRSLVFRPGVIRFIVPSQVALRNQLILIVTIMVLFMIVVGIIAFMIWRRFDQRQRDYQARLDKKCAEHESRVVRIFKEDFMELQTKMQEFSQGLKKHNLPYRDYRTFCLFSLFPEYHCEVMAPIDPHSCVNTTDATPFLQIHPLLSPFTVPVESLDFASKGISLFHALLCNRDFLCLLVRVLEEDERTTAQDRSRVASLLCAALQPKMDYLTRIMCDLMSEMLNRLHSQGENRLPTAFRRAETVVDKIISNWLSCLLYTFIKKSIGETLFYFYRALLQQINMGPRDAVTGKARYTLDYSTLLQTELTGLPVTLIVEDPQNLFNLPSHPTVVKVLDCDTISQTKEKILDEIYKNIPYSLQLKSIQLDLINVTQCSTNASAPTFLTSTYGSMMSDWDPSVRRELSPHGSEKPPFPLNCISDYGLTDNTRVALVRCHRPMCKLTTASPTSTSSMHPTTLGCKNSSFSQSVLSKDGIFETTSCPGRSKLVESNSTTHELEPFAPSCGDTNHLQSICSPIGPTHHSALDTSSLGNPFSCMRPTGSPNASLWYHLELVISGSRTPSSHSDRAFSPRGSFFLASLGLKSRCTQLRGSDTHCCSCICPTKIDRKCRNVPKWPFSHLNHEPSSELSRSNAVADPHSSSIHHPLLHPSTLSARIVHKSRVSDGEVAFIPHISRRSLKRGIAERPISIRSVSSERRIRRTAVGPDRLVEDLPKEVFFNRLMVTRLSVANYMDKLFELIFSCVTQSQSLPSPIKYLFDFLDNQALRLGVQDPKIVHAWKSNCLQMRFWNQIITNLDYIFDIPLPRHTAFERSFHALSQAMTYACAPTREKLTPDSSLVKLLFARDISKQWTRVNNYYREIKAMPAIEREDMQKILDQHSFNHANDFNVSWAVYELYTKYVRPCFPSLVSQLHQESLKAVYQCKGQQTPSSKNAPLSNHCIMADDFECSEYSQMQLVQMLTEVEQCMENAQTAAFLARSTKPAPRQPSDPCPPVPARIDPQDLIEVKAPGPRSAFLLPASSRSGDTTEYPDTLHSINTLTTEFAGYDSNRQQPRPAQHRRYLHCYHVYESDIAGAANSPHPHAGPMNPSSVDPV